MFPRVVLRLLFALITVLSGLGWQQAQAEGAKAEPKAQATQSHRPRHRRKVDREPPVIRAMPFPTNVPAPLPVGVSLFVNSLSKLNDQTGTFEANCDLTLRWRDPSLAFDAKEHGTDRQEFGGDAALEKLSTMWTPMAAISNLSDKTAVGKPGLFIYADGSVKYVQRFKTAFDAKYKMSAFPFDTQELPIQLLSSKFSVNQIAFIQEQRDVDASGFRDNMKVSGWTPKRLDFSNSRIRAWNGEFVPQIEARIIVTRQPMANLVSIFTPFMLVMLVPTVITLYSKEATAPKLTAWAGAILGLVALSFTFSVRFPTLDSDSLVAQVVATGFAYQTVMVLLTVSYLNPTINEKLANKYVIAGLSSVFRWAMPVCLLAFIVTQTMLTALTW